MAPAALPDPEAHGVQEVAAEALYVFAAQVVQVNFDAALYVPAAQSTQVSALLVPDGYLPALHASISIGSWTLVKVSSQ